MASENTVQKIIHSIEQGTMQNVIKSAMIGGLIVLLFLLYLYVHFRGFSSETAMDQAQLARSIASGEGFSTKYIRPFAIGKLSQAEKSIPTGNFPDFYNAPLNPIVNSVALLMVKPKWNMSPKDIIYIGDRIIALFSILFFLASVAVGFFIARRLFDTKLALLASACVLATDLLWQFSLSGLPQMLMLLLFMLACWFMLCAMIAELEARKNMVLVYLVAAALFFGLVTLAHGLGFWLFLGFLVFVAIYFRPLGIGAITALIVYLLVVSPWLIYNFQVCGNPLGLGIYDGLTSDNTRVMRSLSPDINVSSSNFKSKITGSMISQVGSLFGYLGLNFAALIFFISLLHPFRRPETGQFRWGILLIWFFAVLGMALFNVGSAPVNSNQLHVLFIPLMVFYGLAFVLVLWHRLEIGAPLFRLIFIICLITLSGIPMILRLAGGSQGSINWPPYIPPYIGILREWTTPDEIITSDMPWAVAWYAQRKCLLLPSTVKSFNEINDYRLLGHPIVGLYLTPLSGNQRFVSDILKGPYKEWAPWIMRSPNLKGTAFQAAPLPLPIEGETIFYADRPRWNKEKK